MVGTLKDLIETISPTEMMGPDENDRYLFFGERPKVVRKELVCPPTAESLLLAAYRLLNLLTSEPLPKFRELGCRF